MRGREIATELAGSRAGNTINTYVGCICGVWTAKWARPRAGAGSQGGTEERHVARDWAGGGCLGLGGEDQAGAISSPDHEGSSLHSWRRGRWDWAGLGGSWGVGSWGDGS